MVDGLDLLNQVHGWLHFKDVDYAMEKYNSTRTESVYVFHHIELDVLSDLLEDLKTIYIKSNEGYGSKEDFIEEVLGLTVRELKEFTARKYTWYGAPEEEYSFYYFFSGKGDAPFTDYLVDANKDIEFYQKYFKQVIKLIEEFDYDKTPLRTSSNIQTSYEWFASKDSKDEELNELYVKMKDLIVDTNFDDFSAVFSKVPSSEFKPIRWKSNSPSEALYFVKSLMDQGVIVNESRWNYKRFAKCFTRSDGTTFSEKLKVLKARIETDLSVTHRQTIDDIVASIA